jgi:hypothetical protein
MKMSELERGEYTIKNIRMSKYSYIVNLLDDNDDEKNVFIPLKSFEKELSKADYEVNKHLPNTPVWHKQLNPRENENIFELRNIHLFYNGTKISSGLGRKYYSFRIEDLTNRLS